MVKAEKLFAAQLKYKLVESLVWLQGIVVELGETNDTMTIDDGTGLIWFINVLQARSFLAKDEQQIKEGDFVKILAAVDINMEANVLIAKKISILHKNYGKKITSLGSNAETMWMLEVIDSQLLHTFT